MTKVGLDPAALDRLLSELRPRLHRYCARMLGSAFEGEDVVQEALARAAQALPQGGIERPESWLFKVAHHAALDALRARRRQPALADADLAGLGDMRATADARVAAAASLATFLALPVSQRSCVLLVDVLGHQLHETAAILGLSLPAVKAALHRGRARLRELAQELDEAAEVPAAERERLRAYADRFNARDFDALRELLAEDVRLDLVNRARLRGRKEVAVYFHRYAESRDWRFAAGLAGGRPALLVSDPADPGGRIGYVVLLDWQDGRVGAIRDFRYAGYVMDGLATTALPIA